VREREREMGDREREKGMEDERRATLSTHRREGSDARVRYSGINA